MYYYILPTNQDLQHHGVLGMKWGVRRYQPYSVVPRGSGKGGKEIGEAKAYKKIAKGNVKLAYKNIKENARSYELMNKKTAKLEKKNSKKAQAYKEKNAEKQAERKKILDEAMSQIDAADLVIGQKEVTKFLNNAQSRDMALNSALATTGYNLGLTALRAAGIPAFGPPFMVIPDLHGMAATKYINKNRGNTPINYTTVIKDSQKENKSSNILSSNKSSSKASELATAKKEGKYDIGFLEAIQNSEIMYTNNKSEMIKEYSKYLDNPDDYWKNGRHKLKEY